MATETTQSPPDVTEAFEGDWRLGLASGFLGGLAFGAVVSVTDPSVLRSTIPAIYGVAPPGDVVLGWVVHMLHATLLGIAFSAVIGMTNLSGASAREQVGAGIVFALVSWGVLAVVALPLWVGLLGSPVSVSFPYVDGTMLAGHAVYGTVMGVVYFAFDAPEDDTSKTATSGD
jgi:hypothetical protein